MKTANPTIPVVPKAKLDNPFVLAAPIKPISAVPPISAAIIPKITNKTKALTL